MGINLRWDLTGWGLTQVGCWPGGIWSGWEMIEVGFSQVCFDWVGIDLIPSRAVWFYFCAILLTMYLFTYCTGIISTVTIMYLNMYMFILIIISSYFSKSIHATNPCLLLKTFNCQIIMLVQSHRFSINSLMVAPPILFSFHLYFMNNFLTAMF